jgi:hypothetical protein
MLIIIEELASSGSQLLAVGSLVKACSLVTVFLIKADNLKRSVTKQNFRYLY